MTAETGTLPEALACECEMQMIEAFLAIWPQIGRVWSVNGPWLVVTTGGLRIPAVPALRHGPAPPPGGGAVR